MFNVRSSGESGKCMRTSCALKISIMLFSGTPLGIPVVPEVYNLVVSSYVVRDASTGGSARLLISSSNGIVPGTGSPTATMSAGRCAALSRAAATVPAIAASCTNTRGRLSSRMNAISPAERRKLIGDPIAPAACVARYSCANSGPL